MLKYPLLPFLFVILFHPVTGLGSESLPARAAAPYFHVDGADAGYDRLPLKRTSTEVIISGVIASVVIKQTYANLGTQPINAHYIFPGSTRSAVTGMTMTIGDRVIRAQIKEKETARKIFEAAKSAGKNASLLQQQRPNVFSTDVANVMPGDNIDIELTYTELLEADKGVYEFVYPAVVGPRYGGAGSGTDPGQHWIENPYLHAGKSSPAEFDFRLRIDAPLPVQELTSTSHAITARWSNQRSATVLLDRSEANPGNRDFILHYRLQQGEIVVGLMRYEGEHENYFLLLAEPPQRVRPEQIPAREYIFIVDVSGSMAGFPLDVSKSMLRGLVTRLKPADTFNMLFFAGSAFLLAPESLPASKENLDRALSVLDTQQGGGGTELLNAMERAFNLPRKEHTARSIVILTDGYISAERPVFEKIRANLNNTNVFAFGIGSSVNRYLIEGIARAGNGATFIATNQQEVMQTAQNFIDYIETPLLTGISIDAGDVTLYDVEPAVFADLLGQRPLLVYGKYRDAGRKATISLRGLAGNGEFTQQFVFNPGNESSRYRPIQWLWARKRIAALSDFYWGDPEDNRAAITSLGLQYSLLTRYTSFVAVDEIVRNSGTPSRDVKQPLPMPANVSNLAVGKRRDVPEPSLTFMLCLLLIASLVVRLPNRHRTR